MVADFDARTVKRCLLTEGLLVFVWQQGSVGQGVGYIPECTEVYSVDF